MERLLELLIRYSKATNIPLPVKDNKIDVHVFFTDARSRGYLSEDTYSEICYLLK